MRLFYASPSPFARKVRVLIAEKQLSGIEAIKVNPFAQPSELVQANPLSKVPALCLPDGTMLYDSPVICDYLDRRGKGPALIPQDGPARWAVLRRQALADGLMDTGLSLSLEINRRPEEERSPKWIAHWVDTMARCVAAMETEIAQFGAELDLGHISTACALAYLDLRAAAHLDWRGLCPALTAWFAAFEQRPSMQSTRPE